MVTAPAGLDAVVSSLWGLSRTAGTDLDGVTFSQEGDDHYAWHPEAGDDFAGMLHVDTDHLGQQYVDGVHVHPNLANRGIARALWERAGKPLHDPQNQTPEGAAWAQSVGGPDRRYAGKNGPLPPMTMQPYYTQYTNGIMARHAEDGRPLGHLHWDPEGEIDTTEVHPDFRRRGVGAAMLDHARSNPQDYPTKWGEIYHSNDLTPAGRAWANSDPTHQDPGDENIHHAGDETTWGWRAIQNHVPAHVPYTGQNEDELSGGLVPLPKPQPYQPYVPAAKKLGAAPSGSDWPAIWGDDHLDEPWDKRWNPNHREHQRAHWDV